MVFGIEIPFEKPDWLSRIKIQNGCLITRVTSLRNNNSTLCFSFDYKNESIKGCINRGYGLEYIEGKYFPIAYDSLNPHKNKIILISDSDFGFLNLTKPDSIKYR